MSRLLGPASERCINCLKQWRDIATRYEKPTLCLTGLPIAEIFLWPAR
ncbi:hypothetical protein [Streptomyces sp. NBC_01334]|nr:hypothetical protein OG736_43705 [Streptomyces sp. NBC_01334]